MEYILKKSKKKQLKSNILVSFYSHYRLCMVPERAEKTYMDVSRGGSGIELLVVLICSFF